MTEIEGAIVILVAAAIVAVAARRFRFPQTLALMLLGLVLGATQILPHIILSADLILLVFLPPLLFEAAFVLDLTQLWRNRREVLVLAGPGVVIATLAGGVVIQAWLGTGWSIAFLFGAIVAATDPVSVFAIFRRLGVEKRLASVVEGESLLNDGVALVVFAAVLEIVEGSSAGAGIAVDFVRAIAFGVGIGLAVSWAGKRLLAIADDHLTEMVISLAVAYGAFLGADLVGGSGVLATLTSAVVLGRLWRQESPAYTPMSHRLLADLWSLLAFLANAALFVLIGLEIRVAGVTDYPVSVVAGIAAALVGRAAVAYGLGAFLDRFSQPVPRPERHLLFWGGLRGAVALAAALSLPADLPARNELLAMTYGAVLFTNLVQGLTIGAVVKRLGLQSKAAA